MKIGAWVLNFCLDTSSRPMWSKSCFLDPRPWGHYDSWENEVVLVKIGARFWIYGFICLLDPRRKITYHPLLIGFFDKLISLHVVGCNMLHLHVAELNSCGHYNFMHQWVISYQGKDAELNRQFASGIDLNKMLSDLLKLRIKAEKPDIQFLQHTYSSLAVNYALD